MTRHEVTFPSGNDECAAWLYRPAGAATGSPCVVMAHGFSLTRYDGLELYASALAAAALQFSCSITVTWATRRVSRGSAYE